MLAIAIIVIIADAVLILIYGLATGMKGSYIELILTVAFFEGGALLTLGAFLEFFHVGGTSKLNKMLLSPQELFSRWDALKESDSERRVKEGPAGWTIIFIGTTLMLLSIAVLLTNVK